MTLQEAKSAIRSFIREHLSDEKLAAVYAFNRDGKMDMWQPCACLVGVASSKRLHETCREGGHYASALSELHGAVEAERGYNHIAFEYADPSTFEDPGLRQRILSTILRAEMRRRERAREAKQRMHSTADPQAAAELTMLLEALQDGDPFRINAALLHIESLRHLAAMTAHWEPSESREVAGVAR